jgi:ATP-binding cassette subfamily B protein
MTALRSINKYLIKYRYRLIAGVLFIVLSNFFGVLAPVFIRGGIDLVLSNANLIAEYKFSLIPTHLLDDFYSGIIYFSSLTILFAVLRGVFMFFMRQSIIVMSRYIEFDQKNELFKKYQSLDVLFFKKHFTGDLMTRITEDVSKVRMYYGPGLMYTFNLMVLTALVVYQMLRVSPTLAFYSMLPLPVMLLCIFYINRKVEQKSKAIQEQLSSLNTYVQEAYSGIRVIKAFVRQDIFSTEFEKACQNYRNRTLSLVRLEAVYFPVIACLVGISIVSTIYIGGQLVREGVISPGVIVEFIIYINMVTWPFAAVGWVTALIQQAAVSQNRINEFLHAESQLQSGNSQVHRIEVGISFEQVSFTYPDTGIEAVKNVSFGITRGSKLAIVGSTGSGKSTLAMLLSRAFDPSQGSVKLDGVDIRNFEPSGYRSLIGLVPQDVFIFSDSISNNIAFGLSSPDKNQTIRYAQSALLHADVMRFNEQYDTRVGERGVTLSGGQKQRLAIARALAKQPQLLILDDALSAVDAATEEMLIHNIIQEVKGTIILITHRLSAIKDFDLIIVMDEGRIVESGTHHDLIQNRSLYFELASKQPMEAS